MLFIGRSGVPSLLRWAVVAYAGVWFSTRVVTNGVDAVELCGFLFLLDVLDEVH